MITLEQFEHWANMTDQINDIAYEFFDTIRKDYPSLLNDLPARCFYEGVETTDTSDLQLLVNYSMTDNLNRSFRLFAADIKRLLEDPIEAAEKYAETVIALREQENLKKQKTFDEEREKDMAEYSRIKTKYGL